LHELHGGLFQATAKAKQRIALSLPTRCSPESKSSPSHFQNLTTLGKIDLVLLASRQPTPATSMQPLVSYPWVYNLI
jgi:hypothetical protein